MRIIFAALITCGSANLVEAADWPKASTYTYEAVCDQYPEEENCLHHAAEFAKYYEKAIKGDYEGQRMVAWALSGDVSGILVRPALACAWSQVILRSGHLEATPDDTKNNKHYCDRLDADERTLAEAQAERMMTLLKAR